MALFVVALVAGAAFAMVERLRINIRRTELLLNNNQAYLYAQGSIAWAMDYLNVDWKEKKTGKLVDSLPAQSPANKENNATITSTIQDAQANFNLNNLIDPSYQQSFTRLIQVIAPDTDAESAKNITQAAVDWITPGIINSTFDQYYAKLDVPYRAPHHIMSSASELRLIKGVTAKLYNQLIPYLTALPDSNTPINVNTAPAPVLMSLMPRLTATAAKTILLYRKQNPFIEPQQFLALEVIKNNLVAENKIDNKITVISGYFLTQTTVSIGKQQITLYTLLQRITKNSQPKVIVLWQTKGTL